MKFFGGFITGVLTTVLVLVLIYAVGRESDRTFLPGHILPGLTMLPEKGECIVSGEIEIFQAIRPNVALARQLSDRTLFLLIGNENDFFYDRQRMVIPANKCARKVGVYRYELVRGGTRTVPAVVIEYR